MIPRRLLLAAGAAALTGCAATPTNYYRLAAIPGAIRTGITARIGVRGVSIPGYLDQTGIVRVSGAYQFDTYANELWAEPLAGMLQAVLVQDLAQILPGTTVLASGGAPWSFSLLMLAILARVTVALTIGVGLLRDDQVLRDLWLLPVRDVFGLLVWAWSFAGDTVIWRGEEFRLKDGRIFPV